MKTLTLALIGATFVAAGSVRVSPAQTIPSHLMVEQQKMRIADRQKQLVADSDKLLSLSTSLREQMNESNKNILSLDMIKKADEIEKLAHSLKERMKE